MSNLESEPREAVCGGRAEAAVEPVLELMPGREVVLGGTRGMKVTRTLPTRGRRMVGAWCFADHYGPERVEMRVPPHPHTGLQTVSWLVEGAVLHRDSLGSEQLIRPGRLNLMTAGRGIAHSEESPRATADGATGAGGTGDAGGTLGVLHGVQLWVALPGPDRDVAPHFEHHGDLPVLAEPGATVKVIMGELGGAVSPARVYTPIVGAEAALDAGARLRLPARPDFEYALLGLSGEVEAEGADLAPGPLLYLGAGRTSISLTARYASRVLLLGGEPFDEQIVMWWNFVGRSHDDIVRYRKEWASGEGFGTVHGFDGDPLPAPDLPSTPLKARGRVR
ncbi:pirin family protein [Thermopolyspora sp. NPDC052614]|uniref:pirin family protein n=1 Tax=Thermopolyspora sp. NPDC052614 TaxID=3155682 RepID=UPI00343BF406